MKIEAQELVFKGKGPVIKCEPRVVMDRHRGEYYEERLEGGGPRLVETAGFIDKTTQLRILQQSGENLERYYRRLFPAINAEEGEGESEQKYGTQYPDIFDYFDRSRIVSSRIDEAILEKREEDRLFFEEEAKKMKEFEDWKASQAQSSQSAQPVPPVENGGSQGAGVPES